ncbi:MAG TPA: NUDIX domain-containing protein [Patescibacteria group bacterium]|jgi:ADP-ribose pyrophosphatase YjhB (NUDIX family)
MPDGGPRPGINYVGISTSFYCHDGKGHFLLALRGKNCRDEQGTWDPGGGQLEFGMAVDENVLTEIREEYGCEGTIQEVLPAYSVFRDLDGVRTHWLAIPHFVLIERGTERNNEPHKFDDLGWFPCGEWPQPLHQGFAQAYERYRDRFEKYRR